MKLTKYALLVTIGLAVQGLVWGQTITYSGTIPQTFSILDGSNGPVTLSDVTAFVASIGSGSMSESTQSVRLRSNAGYKLSAQVTANTGIAAGTAAAAAGTTGNAITLADIGFGVSGVLGTGASVVGGGGTPTRTDTTATAFVYATPTPTDGRITWTTGTMSSILTSATQILTGDRISASGDNGSDDNFLTVSLKAGYLPEYFTPGNFTVVVTLTLAASGA